MRLITCVPLDTYARTTVPPKINYLAPSNKLDVPKGTAIKLECRASGKPAPAIIWSRKVSLANNHNNIASKVGQRAPNYARSVCVRFDETRLMESSMLQKTIELNLPFSVYVEQCHAKRRGEHHEHCAGNNARRSPHCRPLQMHGGQSSRTTRPAGHFCKRFV